METKHKRSHNDDLAKIGSLHQFFRGKLLTSITRDQLIAIAERKRIEASESTANRYMALIRAICATRQRRMGVDRQSAEGEDVQRGASTRSMDHPRTGAGTHGGADASSTGLDLVCTRNRFAAIKCPQLTWEQVDLVRRTAWIPAADAKNGEDNPRITEPVRRRIPAAPSRQTSTPCLHARRSSDQPAQH
jgi:hypothetical protein